jgi:hypothetical protein
MHPLLVLIVLVSGVLAAPSIRAEGGDSLRLSFAKSSETDLATVVIGDYDASQESNYLISASWGRQYSDTLFGLPFPMTANIGLQYLAERGYQEDGVGGTAFIKAHYDWKLPFTNKYIRLGLGEGLSYVSRVPMSEQRDFATKGVESEKLMNYMEWTIDVPLRQFSPAMHANDGGVEDVSIGFIVWHRSSVFGVFADEGGGVNFMGFGIEARY